MYCRTNRTPKTAHTKPTITNIIFGAGSNSVSTVDTAVIPTAISTAPLNKTAPSGSATTFLPFILKSENNPMAFLRCPVVYKICFAISVSQTAKQIQVFISYYSHVIIVFTYILHLVHRYSGYTCLLFLPVNRRMQTDK